MTPSHQSQALIEEWRQDSDRILALLRAQYDQASSDIRKSLHDRANKAAQEAMRQFNTKISRLPELKRRTPDEHIAINLEYRAPKNAFATYGGPQIEWGMANAEKKTVLLLRWLIFAPKEVIRGVVIHEAFHILFAALDPSCLPDLPIDETLEDYPEHQRKEEQWVRKMTKTLGYDEHLITIWEQALLVGGDNWRVVYPDIKKDLKKALSQD